MREMRKEYKYSYTICNYFAPEWFDKQCSALEKHIPNLKKHNLLEDVDGSKYQKYDHPRGEIEVANDYEVGALYIDSDFDIEPYFS